jgi:hypothetical protein
LAGLGALKRALCLLDCRLKRALFDFIERSAFFDDIALFEKHRLQITFHAGLNRNPIDRLDTSDKITGLGYWLALSIDCADWNRLLLCITRCEKRKR